MGNLLIGVALGYFFKPEIDKALKSVTSSSSNNATSASSVSS